MNKHEDEYLPVTADSEKMQQTTVLSIEGMTCGACTAAVERALQPLDGVVDLKISLLAERAVVIHDASVCPEKIAGEIEDAGFDTAVISSDAALATRGGSSSTVRISVHGLFGPETAACLEGLLKGTTGVCSAAVNLSKHTATVTFEPGLVSIRSIVGVIESTGYGAVLADTEHTNAQLQSLAKTTEMQRWKRSFCTCLFFATPVFVIHTLLPWLLPQWDFGVFRIVPGLCLRDLLCGLLTAPVQFGIGKQFYMSAWKSIKHRSPTMDVLVVLGTSAAFLFSCFAMLIAIVIPPHSEPATVFDASTMLITFIILGRWIECRVKGQTSTALSKLMSLAPSMAVIYDDAVYAEKLASTRIATIRRSSESSSRLRRDSPERNAAPLTERTIPTELLEAGDVVVLRPGDKVPADGVVIYGESWINESMVTGEAEAVLKRPQSDVLAGTVNGSGHLDVRVTRAGKNTRLSQIVDLVHQAQSTRAPIQRLADQVAGYFVPVIVILGLATFVVWTLLGFVLKEPPAILVRSEQQSGGKVMIALTIAISVIVFACPCALGLATPTAIMVGTGVASQHGILIKGGGAALETANKITHIVLDKTGSLTFGKFTVAQTAINGRWTARKDLWWALLHLAESRSEHPLGKAIVECAGDSTLPEGYVKTFQATTGQGIRAEIVVPRPGGDALYVVLAGSAAHLKSMGVDVPPTDDSTLNMSCLTLVHVGINGTHTGTLGLSDTLKTSARAAVTALHKMGISTSLVTGDNLAAAEFVARQVGIPSSCVRANVSPEGKRLEIARVQADGHSVAMVGDGINDSPALAAADLGIGLASGSDVAIEAADIVLMQPDDLLNIAAAIALSRTSFRKIKANLYWACGYNLVGLPFAMGFLVPWGLMMPPALAGAAMALSSISVTLNSLTLRWWKRPTWLDVDRLEAEAVDIDLPPGPGVSLVAMNKRGVWRKCIEAVGNTLHSFKHSYSELDEKMDEYAALSAIAAV